MTQEPTRELKVGSEVFDDAGGEEAWAALRQLLDAAQSDYDAALGDERALVDGVRGRIARRRSQRRRLSLAAAVALLACAGATWFAAGRPSDVADRRPVAALPRAADWNDDALDLELTWTMYNADAIESQWRRPADGLAFVRQQMDALEAEFNGDSL